MLRQKSFGNFLTERDQKGEYVTAVEDKIWKYASMMLAHILRDNVENCSFGQLCPLLLRSLQNEL